MTLATDTEIGGPNRHFPSTIWSDVVKAGDPATPENRDCVNHLVAAYWKPVYVYVRTSWHKSSEDAKDLTQAFFAHFLEKGYLADLRPDRGSFRGYLRKALRHFLIDLSRLDEVRRPVKPVVSLDAPAEELERLAHRAEGETPEELFDRQWFECVFESAIVELEARLVAQAKQRYLDVFRLHCRGKDDAAPSYRAVAEQVGIKEDDVRNYLSFCRRLLRDILRQSVREYVASDREADEELDAIIGNR